MDQIIIIKCPKCGKYFALKNEPTDINVMVRCLACRESAPYYQLISVKEEIVSKPPRQLPVLRLISPTHMVYYLKVGQNVIGRYAASSKADIQIDTTPFKHISREHAVVEVKEVNGNYMCYFSLHKKEINDTYVSNRKVAYGDSVCLTPGDRLLLPDNAVLEYQIEVQD